MILSLGCDDDAATSSSVSAGDGFPNQIGHRWTYLVSEYAGGPSDTVDVQVVSVGTSPLGEQARVWHATYRNWVDTADAPLVDTMWVVEAGDTVKVYRSRPPRVMSFIMPLEVDNSWTTSGFSDTTTVVGTVSQVSYPGGLLQNGFRLDRQWQEEGVGSESSTLIVVPDVGIVVMNLNAVSVVEPTGANLNQWRILSFSL
jgi:hypothetical protein